jgi:hypothetical protein
VKTINLDGASIDYFQNLNAVQRGLTNRFGIRIRESGCLAVIKIGDREPSTFGKDYALPVAVETLPSYLRIIVDNHVLNYPASDLMDVLTGKKSFQEALDAPPRIEPKRTAVSRLELHKEAS